MRRAGQRVLRSTRRRHCSAAPAVEAMDSDSSPPERYSFNPSLRWNPEVEEYFTKAYGAERFARICKSLTHPSCYSCIRVNTLKSTSDAVIKKLVNILDEKRLLSGFSSTESCDQNAADVVGQPMNEGASKETLITKCKYPGLDYVLFLKGSGPHVPLYRDYCGQPLKEVIVRRKCAEAVLRGAEVFVPGVLACSSHVEKGDIVAVSVAVEQPGSDGGWGVGITRGTVLQGSESDPYYHERNGLYIGQGVTLMSRAGIFRSSEGIAIQMTNRVYELPSFNNVLEGEIFLQNLPSIIAAHVLDPQQGEHILDMCAAPGGKTTAIAVLMRDKGEIVAIDRSHNKVMEILKLAAEMDLTSICAYRLDALKSVCQNDEIVDVGVKKFDKEASDTVIVDSGLSAFANGDRMIYNTKKCSTDLRSSETDGNSIANQGMYISKADLRKNMRRMKNGPGKNQTIGCKVSTSKGYKPNTFDRVLVDAPCSALGLRPRLFAGEETVESLRSHGRYQRRMFDQAVQLVRPGGVIVYSTCTINPGENEALVRYALDTYKFLSLASQHPRIGGPGLVGRCELFGGKYKEEWLTPTEAELVQRFDPSSSLDTIGFFIAKFNVGQKDILSTSSTTLGVL